MTNKRSISRIAGVLYLVVVVTGMFSLAYVPKQLFIWDNPAQTFNNILTHESLFRLSIASSVLCYIAFIFLPIALYHLLKSVNQFYAQIMVLLVMISIPISFSNLQNKYAVLSLIETLKQPGAITGEIHKQTMLYLNQYDHGIFVVTIFWGLWLLPFGYLVYKSTFLPKFLGILLMLGGLGYLINYFGNTLSGNYREIGVSQYLSLLPAIGEIGTCLWLLFIGAREKLTEPSQSN
ncbi:DUF4386 domain-containing protein [Pedobacter montanisoli]|uniref:DUF4386 domain-containing protein n=1 Tax=Pedobacter montanisoli TaxID=2923277 RepID=A0ABT0A019_9SPHI|nr:DUF4386 domain-containing protein [Pedobacter montanisoli]MCJ0743907.1 DUF4386 domain-containing protein [Pedobacter montanisoli]